MCQQQVEGLIGINKRLATAIIFVLFLSSIPVSIPVKAQTTSSIAINSDGSVTGTYSIKQVGDTYSLTANISGNIQVQKSGITIDGSGYSLNGRIDLTNGIGPNLPSPTRPEITNVTVKNLYVNGGVGTNGGGNDTFYNDCFLSGDVDQGNAAIFLLGCSYNNISYCTFDNGSQISMDYSSAYNTVTQCNLPPCSVLIWLSGYENVDKNYWSDYSTKYPNAAEVDHSGVGDRPYVYYSTQETSPNDTKSPIGYQDNHPLMKSVTIPLIASTSSPSPTAPELPWLVIMPLLVSLFSVAALLKYRKTALLRNAD